MQKMYVKNSQQLYIMHGYFWTLNTYRQTMTEILWQPSAERIKSTQLTRFIKRIQQKHGISNTDFSTLHQWSVSNPAEFWEEVWQDCDIIVSASYISVMGERRMPGTTWFDGAMLNYAENLLRYRELEREAIIFVEPRIRRRFDTIFKPIQPVRQQPHTVHQY